MQACLFTKNQIPFISRKDIPTQNILATFSFDMQFMFVWLDEKNSAYNMQIFLKAIDNPNIEFPKLLKSINEQKI